MLPTIMVLFDCSKYLRVSLQAQTMNKERHEYSGYQKVSLVNVTTGAPGELIYCLCIDRVLHWYLLPTIMTFVDYHINVIAVALMAISYLSIFS